MRSQRLGVEAEQKIDRKTSVAVRGETVLFIGERKRLEGRADIRPRVPGETWTNEIRDTKGRGQSRDGSSRRSSRSVGTRPGPANYSNGFTKRASCPGPDQNSGSGSYATYQRHFFSPTPVFISFHSAVPRSIMRPRFLPRREPSIYPFAGRLFSASINRARG